MTHLVERDAPAAAQKARYLEDCERAGRRWAGPAWVRRAREQAIGHFDRLGFPTTRLEEWRFTNVAPMAERAFALAGDGPTGLSDDQAARLGLQGPAAAVIVCVNGRYAPHLSSRGALPPGCGSRAWSPRWPTTRTRVEPYLARLAPPANGTPSPR